MVASRAFRTLQIIGLIAFIVSACGPRADEFRRQKGELTPSSVNIGTDVLVSLTHPDTNFTRCDSLENWNTETATALGQSFQFYKGSTDIPATGIALKSVEHVGTQRLSVYLSIDETAQAGLYEMRFVCGKTQVIPARFRILETSTKASLRFEPGYLYAGKSNQTVLVRLIAEDGNELTLPDAAPSSVIFGDNSTRITYDDVKWQDDVLNAIFTVSDLALDVDESERTVKVSFVYAPELYTGELVIIPDNAPYVVAESKRIEKPAAGDEPNRVNITLNSKNLSFSPDEFSVSAPYNPGVEVVGCTVSEANAASIICALSVTNSAYPEPTVLQIEAGAMTQYASINVVPADFNDLMVRFWPRTIDNCMLKECVDSPESCTPELLEECPPQMVVAEMIGAELDDSWRVNVETPGVIKSSEVRAGPDHWILGVNTGGNSDLKSADFVFTNDVQVVRSHLLIRDVAGKSFRAIDWQTFDNPPQGYSFNMVMELQNAVFTAKENEVSVFIPPRSAVSIEEAPILGKSTVLNRKFRPLPDSPTGPAVLTFSGEPTLSSGDVWFEVAPSESSSSFVVAEPNTIWLERPTARVSFHGKGDIALDEETQILVSDPAIQIGNVTYETVEVEEESGVPTTYTTAVLDMNIAPTARAGTRTFYFSDVNGRRAAATVRGLKSQTLVLNKVEPPAIYRSVGQGKIRVRIDDKYRNAPLALSVFNDIGVAIERYYYVDGYLAIVFTLEKEGPGGWIGVSVNRNGERFVIPVRVHAEDEDGEVDDSLTALLNKEYVVPGSSNDEDLVISMQGDVWRSRNAPAFGSMVSEVFPLDSGVYARIDNISDEGGTSLRMAADFAHTLDLPSEDAFPGVPVGVTTSEGAAVGFWKIHDEDRPLSSEEGIFMLADADAADDDASHIVESGGSALIRGYFTDSPASLVQIRGSLVGKETYESAPIALLSSRGESIDRSIVVATSTDGVLFGLFDDVFRIWGENDEPYKVRVLNTASADVPRKGTDLCLHPFFKVSRFDNAFEPATNVMPPAGLNCRLAVSVSARTLDDSSRFTPDLVVSACNSNGECVEQVGDPAGGDADPLMYVDADELDTVIVQPMMGSVGYYALNVRQAAVIQSVSLEDGNQYVELRMEPGSSMSGCQLKRFDPEEAFVDVLFAQQPLTGTVPDDGRVFVAPATAAYATVEDQNDLLAIPQGSDFKFALFCNDLKMDAFQVGGSDYSYSSAVSDTDSDSENDDDETNTSVFRDRLSNYSAKCYHRIGNGIDTNNARLDFVPASDCSVL